MAADMISEGATATAPTINTTSSVTSQAIAHPNIALWFLYGALFAMLIYVIIDLIKSRKKN